MPELLQEKSPDIIKKSPDKKNDGIYGWTKTPPQEKKTGWTNTPPVEKKNVIYGWTKTPPEEKKIVDYGWAQTNEKSQNKEKEVPKTLPEISEGFSQISEQSLRNIQNSQNTDDWAFELNPKNYENDNSIHIIEEKATEI